MIFEVFKDQTWCDNLEGLLIVNFFSFFNCTQSSCQELRKQLEDQVVTIDTLRSDNRAAVERHESVCNNHS